MQQRSRRIPAIAVLSLLTACGGSSGNSPNPPSGGDMSVGGGPAQGGSSTSGGSHASGGAATGGTSTLGVGGTSLDSSSLTGGMRSSGGATSTGGAPSMGGVPPVTGGAGVVGGGSATGGSTNSGGRPTGGAVSTGGAQQTGGTKSAGGTSATGGSKSMGGMSTTGGSQSAGGTSAGGSSSYAPCAASPCKILPFGDSITHGLQSTDSAGYRSQLFKLVVAGGQTVTFLGSQSSGPATVSNVTFPKNHEGHDGYTVDSGYSTYGTPGISSLIPSPAFNTIPDIVLLHIGTNDITSTGSASATVSTRLDALLTKIVGVAPKALIVVAKITPVSYTSADLTSYNSKIPGIVQSHASQGQHIIGVDMSQMPKSDLASDGVHPNDAGYAYMANIWYAAIKGYLR